MTAQQVGLIVQFAFVTSIAIFGVKLVADLIEPPRDETACLSDCHPLPVLGPKRLRNNLPPYTPGTAGSQAFQITGGSCLTTVPVPFNGTGMISGSSGTMMAVAAPCGPGTVGAYTGLEGVR